MTMRIGIEAYPLSRQFAGISNYLYNIIKYLEKIDNKNEYFLYSRLGLNLPFKENKHWNIRIMSGLINNYSTSWMLFNAKKQLLKEKIDIFWGTEHILPLNLPKSIKTILTIHDLVWHYYPETMELKNRIIHNLFFKKSILKADRIIAITHSTADGLKEFIPKNNKISVVYYGGAAEHFSVCNKQKSREYVRDKFRISEKYILTVGTVEPRKNIKNLIRAFLILDKYGLKYHLVIAGGKGWRNSNIYKLYNNLNSVTKQRVWFIGYVDNFKDLPKLYSAAEVFVYPSLYEGFGLPPLEAMACGCPVVTSNVSSLPEVCGDAAMLVDPLNIQEIAEAIQNVLTNEDLKNSLIQKGFERVKLFSWKKAARETLEVFNKSL